MIYAVYEVVWTESERGWGQRPDGKSYHKTKPIAEVYIKNYWNGMPKEVPDEYSRPGDPQLAEVSKEIFDEVDLKDSIRVY